MILRVSATILALVAPAAAQAGCENIAYESNRYTLCTVNLSEQKAELFLRDENGSVYGDFSRLPPQVSIAMNGGMYHADRRPVGHYIENGEEVMRVVPNAGPGNFGLLPNGVLCLNSASAEIYETLSYVSAAPTCDHATQSGPMLVIDGELHPRFLEDSTSRKRRNGVGVSEDGETLFLAITSNAVTFHEFGSLFRDYLGVRNALFLDGSISRLYDRENRRSDGGALMGPILAISDRATD